MKIINENYKIYWAHLPEHTNPMTEGYIGITKKRIERRKSEHNRDSKNNSNKTFHRAIRKYGDKIVWEVLEDNYSEFTVKLFECFIRPERNIGWNIAIGGTGGNNVIWDEEMRKKCSELKLGKKLSDEHRNNMSISRKGKKQSDEHIKNRTSKRIGTKLSKERKFKQSKTMLKYPLDLYREIINSNLSSKDLSIKLNIKYHFVWEVRNKHKEGKLDYLT